MCWGHQYIRLLIDNLQDLLVIYSSMTNSLFLLCQWNWQYCSSPDGALALASWFSPRCLNIGPYSKYCHVWPRSGGNTAQPPYLALPSVHMDVNPNEIYASKISHSSRSPAAMCSPDLTLEAASIGIDSCICVSTVLKFVLVLYYYYYFIFCYYMKIILKFSQNDTFSVFEHHNYFK